MPGVICVLVFSNPSCLQAGGIHTRLKTFGVTRKDVVSRSLRNVASAVDFSRCKAVLDTESQISCHQVSSFLHWVLELFAPGLAIVFLALQLHSLPAQELNWYRTFLKLKVICLSLLLRCLWERYEVVLSRLWFRPLVHPNTCRCHPRASHQQVGPNQTP